MSFLDEAKDLVPELLQFRHYIHEHAETGFELPLTTKAMPWMYLGR